MFFICDTDNTGAFVIDTSDGVIEHITFSQLNELKSKGFRIKSSIQYNDIRLLYIDFVKAKLMGVSEDVNFKQSFYKRLMSCVSLFKTYKRPDNMWNYDLHIDTLEDMIIVTLSKICLENSGRTKLLKLLLEGAEFDYGVLSKSYIYILSKNGLFSFDTSNKKVLTDNLSRSIIKYSIRNNDFVIGLSSSVELIVSKHGNLLDIVNRNCVLIQEPETIFIDNSLSLKGEKDVQ